MFLRKNNDVFALFYKNMPKTNKEIIMHNLYQVKDKVV